MISSLLLVDCTGMENRSEGTHKHLKVIWRWWKISLRSEYRNTQPGQLRESHEEFKDDSVLMHKITVVFGPSILTYVSNLCNGEFDYLDRMPDPLILHIMTFLDLNDALRLRCTSSKYKKLCDSDQFWEHRAKVEWGTITPEMESLANILGWKKMFIAYKLHGEDTDEPEEQDEEKSEQQVEQDEEKSAQPVEQDEEKSEQPLAAD
ncbi:F-box only protein 36a isoform X2 [Scleropages formosus]|uniref:F-box protein 36a n=1 Tax=Scleropages formosus TaxID=113540 RepID=A0A8C9RUJ8_SCLFO|nr:F-box only protein 36 isoform X2 [Scleropages formosus]